MWRYRTYMVQLRIILLIVVLALTAMPALAHGEATLTITPNMVAPGGTITVAAEGVEPGEVFTITLVGTDYEAALGTANVGDGDRFEEQFTVPADAPEGFYQVQATSEEGETLTAELTIQSSAPTSQPADRPEPSAEPMQLDRRSTPAERIIILSLLGISAILGVAFIRTGNRLER